MKRTAVLLDRDGTIIEDRGYMGDPDEVQLIPGAADAIRRFARAGHLVVIVSNQSGVARGLFDEEDLKRVHVQVENLLKAEGAQLDGAYYCPYLDGPEAAVQVYRQSSMLRKPEPGMLLQAARELNIDLQRSWMIGDSPSDVEAGERAGCRTILLNRSGGFSVGDSCDATHTVGTLGEAADLLDRIMSSPDEESRRLTGDSHDDAIIVALERIRDQLERAERKGRQQDFSVLRLFGALIQMFAIVAAFWGTLALLDNEAAAATARLTLACFLQLASIATFVAGRFR